MRGAFDAAINDKQLRAEAAKMNLAVSPSTGEDVAALLRESTSRARRWSRRPRSPVGAVIAIDSSDHCGRRRLKARVHSSALLRKMPTGALPVTGRGLERGCIGRRYSRRVWPSVRGCDSTSLGGHVLSISFDPYIFCFLLCIAYGCQRARPDDPYFRDRHRAEEWREHRIWRRLFHCLELQFIADRDARG